MDLARLNRRLLPLCLACLPVCWPGCCCPRTLSLPSHFVVGMPASQASKRARGGQAGRREGGRPAAPLLSSSPAASKPLACLLCTPPPSLLPSPLPPSVVVVLYWRKMRGWPGPLSPSTLSLSLSQAKQQTFGHRIGRRFASPPSLPDISDTLWCGLCYKLTHVALPA